ncbi:hypothetical protein CsatB_006313 [Cannabis sativa]
MESSLLYQAAREGKVAALRELLQLDNLILDKLFINNSFSETPLHVAAMLGHVDFVKEILNHKPDLVKELDMCRCTPLHLAVANGHLETVKLLLSVVDCELLCTSWDEEGRNPLHLAAMRGRIDVLRELLKVAPKACQVGLKGQSGTILHVCVRHNQLEAMKVLVDVIDNYQFVNAKDDYGMTILHLAVTYKQIETVKFLLTNTKIEVNAVNANMFTSLDILAQSQRSEKDFDIVESLRSYGASRTIDQPVPMKRPIIRDAIASPEIRNDHAGISPPGGLWEDHGTSYDESISKNVTHVAGESIISYYPNMSDYHAYLISNTVGFVGSLSIILLLVTGLPFCRKFLMWTLTVILWVTITAMTITYLIAIIVAAPSHDILNTPAKVSLCLVVSWAGVMLLIALLHTIHVAIKLFKWLRNLIIKRIRRRKQNNIDNVETTLM